MSYRQNRKCYDTDNGLILASEDEDSDGDLELHCKDQMDIYFLALSTTIQRNQTQVSTKHKFLSRERARVRLMQESVFKDIPKLKTHIRTTMDSISVSDLDEVICVQTKQSHGNTEDFPIDLTYSVTLIQIYHR